MFSCRTRGFCPSCHAKRLEESGDWVRETLLLDVWHRQVVFTIPRTLRPFFKFNRPASLFSDELERRPLTLRFVRQLAGHLIAVHRQFHGKFHRATHGLEGEAELVAEPLDFRA